MSLTLPVDAGTLADNICASINSEQDRLNAFAAVMSVTLTTTLAPIAAQQSKPADGLAWLKLDSNLRPIRLYFKMGSWLSLHPQLPGSTMIWTGPLPDFTTFDGGSGGGVTDISGAMWEEATELRARFPLGAGTSPAPLSTVYAQGTSSGEEQHKLTTPEIPPIATQIPFFTPNYVNGGPDTHDILVGETTPGKYTVISSTGDPASGTPPTAAAGHNTMPLFYVVYFLRRTARLYYNEGP